MAHHEGIHSPLMAEWHVTPLVSLQPSDGTADSVQDIKASAVTDCKTLPTSKLYEVEPAVQKIQDDLEYLNYRASFFL